MSPKDLEARLALPNDVLDRVATSSRWLAIEECACTPAISHALALDREAGPLRLRAIVHRAYRDGDHFADAFATDRDDEDFARRTTARTEKKAQTLANLIDALVGGGPGLGGSDFKPDHVKLFEKYCDGGSAWESFEPHMGLLRRALGVIERDWRTPAGGGLFDRVRDAIECLDEVRDALLLRAEPARFRTIPHDLDPLTAALVMHFRGEFSLPMPGGAAALSAGSSRRNLSAWQEKAISPSVPIGDGMESDFPTYSGLELYETLINFDGVPRRLDAFLDSLEALNSQTLGFYGIGFRKTSRANANTESLFQLWQIDVDQRRHLVKPARPQDLPRFFFVARLAEVFALATGQMPCFAYRKTKGRYETSDQRWLNLLRAVFKITNLGGDERTLLARLGGSGDFRQEGKGNADCLRNLTKRFEYTDSWGGRVDLDFRFLTHWMVEFARRYPAPPNDR